MTTGEKIVQVASQYVGMHEIGQNAGWDDLRFAAHMAECGWQRGQAWCAYFAELVWKEAMPEIWSELDKLFSAGAVATWNRFREADGWICDKHPQPGDAVIWQHWYDNQPTWKGHAGIVLRVIGPNEIETIEGNTNASGGREGDEVAIKHRMLNFDARTGLVLKGFIHPKNI